MINWKSILSSFNDKPTLLEWLKLVEKALKESVLTSVAAEQDADKTNTRLLFNFEDGTQIVSEFFKTKGDKGRGIASVSSTGQTQSDGFTRSGFKVNYDDKNYDVIYLYAKNGKAISSLSSSVKEVTDDSTINTITVNYDDKTSNTFDVSSARGKQGLKGNDGVSITGIDTVSDEVVGDETLTTLRAHYSNNTTDEFVVKAKNGISTIPLFRKNVTLKSGSNSCLFTTYEKNGDKTVGSYTIRGEGYCIIDGTLFLCSTIQLLNEVNTETVANARIITINPLSGDTALQLFDNSTATITVFEV